MKRVFDVLLTVLLCWTLFTMLQEWGVLIPTDAAGEQWLLHKDNNTLRK